LSGVLETQRLHTNEVFAAVGANGRVGNGRERAGFRDVYASAEDLKLSLLLGISDVDTDLARTKVRQGWFASAILPRYSGILSSFKTGCSYRLSNEGDSKSSRNGGEDNKSFCEHFLEDKRRNV